jgi:hypothetical protein
VKGAAAWPGRATAHHGRPVELIGVFCVDAVVNTLHVKRIDLNDFLCAVSI